MPAAIMEGKSLAARILDQVRARTEHMSERPGLALVALGDDPVSQRWEKSVKRDCRQCGIYCDTFRLPRELGWEELAGLVEFLNGRENMDGIQVLLPLADGQGEQAVLSAIRPDKDVDCLNPVSLGGLMAGAPAFWPCVPGGVVRLLEEYGVDLTGRRCVVVGRSDLSERRQAILLLGREATVTVCQAEAPGLAGACRQADVLITAAGRPGLIPADWVKEGAVVVDAAFTPDARGQLCGDVVWEQVAPRASYIAPVPGGVGPVIRAMLLENTWKAALRHGKT